VDAMAVAAVGGFPAVVVKNAAVDFAVRRAGPEAHALGVVRDDEIDVFAVSAGADFHAAPRAVHFFRGAAASLGDLDGRFAQGDFKIANPDAGCGVGDVQAAIDGHALVLFAADDDGFVFHAGETD